MHEFSSHPFDSFVSLPAPGLPSRVDTPSTEWLHMWEDWRLPYGLWGGTKRMRKAGKEYLPQEEGESDKAYAARLRRTYLYNAYRRTVQALAGQPFTKPVTVHNLPAELEYLRDDADSMGNSITEVAYMNLVNGLHYGKYHILVDYPSVEGNITLRDQREMNIRPYFNTISPLHLIGWQAERAGGLDVLLDVRIKETTIEPLDEFSDTIVTRVRQYKPNEVITHAVYREDSRDFDIESVSTNTLGYVPLVTGYVEQTGFMQSRPPLEDLAWMNLRHWQSSSDQNNILHVARVPVFVGFGFEEGELNNVQIGSHRGITTTKSPSEADLKYLEHTGAAIGSGEKDLAHIEQQMSHMGSDILDQKAVSRQTATARQIDQSESLSVMQLAVRELEHSIEKAIQTAGDWLGVDASEVSVSVGDDLSVNGGEANPIDELQKLGLDEDDLLKELKRRSILSDSVQSIHNDMPEQNEDVEQNLTDSV